MRVTVFALWFCLQAVSATSECVVRDFLATPLAPGADPFETAIETAYPGTDLDPAGGTLRFPDGRVIAAAPAREIPGGARFDGATVGDMFVPRYPLSADPAARTAPWADPGRARNDDFFRALWGDSAAEVRADLVTVAYRGPEAIARFEVTTRFCVHEQLAAALAEAAALQPVPDDWFRDVGGSFNWRLIAGTDRLSAHSFGTAIDLNTALGGYWRWAGEAEGDVGAFATTMPPELVAIFERRGFIWGGKWHHYDGMHFEYRPELILYARAAGG